MKVLIFLGYLICASAAPSSKDSAWKRSPGASTNQEDPIEDPKAVDDEDESNSFFLCVGPFCITGLSDIKDFVEQLIDYFEEDDDVDDLESDYPYTNEVTYLNEHNIDGDFVDPYEPNYGNGPNGFDESYERQHEEVYASSGTDKIYYNNVHVNNEKDRDVIITRADEETSEEIYDVVDEIFKDIALCFNEYCVSGLGVFEILEDYVLHGKDDGWLKECLGVPNDDLPATDDKELGRKMNFDIGGKNRIETLKNTVKKIMNGERSVPASFKLGRKIKLPWA